MFSKWQDNNIKKKFIAMKKYNKTISHYVTEKNVIKNYGHWVLALRPSQLTCYSLMLFADSDAELFSELDTNSLNDLGNIFSDIELCIKLISQPIKFNYHSLMLVDPHVHFHIFPRFEDQDLDSYWPNIVDLHGKVIVSEIAMADRLKKLKGVFL
jgi:diadenosine tetraphosphate (Ap4A) HIT family hydrolase